MKTIVAFLVLFLSFYAEAQIGAGGAHVPLAEKLIELPDCAQAIKTPRRHATAMVARGFFISSFILINGNA